MFETPSLILRGFLSTDGPNLLRLWNNPLVQPTFTGHHIVPRSQKFIDTTIMDSPQKSASIMSVIIVTKESNEFVGYAFFSQSNPKNRDTGFSIALLPEHWGKGYGKEVTKFMVDYAFEEMNMQRVSLSVFKTNERAVSLYKKLGFVEEGIKRRANWAGGKWQDSIYMGLLQEEWEELRTTETKANGI